MLKSTNEVLSVTTVLLKLNTAEFKFAMDLQAANNATTGAWRFTRIGMIACFLFASALLIASLTMAHSQSALPVTSSLAPSP